MCCVRRPSHSQSKFLKIISNDEDVMEDQIYVLPEKWITKRTGLSMGKFFEDYYYGLRKKTLWMWAKKRSQYKQAWSWTM